MHRKMIVAFTAASLWGSALAQPLAADPWDCYEAVLVACEEAMEDANLLERFALGLACTGMLAGCAVGDIEVSISFG